MAHASSASSVRGIIASLAAPSFTDYIGRKRVEGFASELASDLQYARSEAVSRNTAVRVVFTSATAYTIQVETPLPSALTCTASGTVATIKTQTLTNGVTLTGSGGGALPTCFAFEPVRGSAPANGIVEATLGSARLRLGVGSSGRVFPLEMKAAPLLRAWLHRLRHPASGVPVQFHMRHRWQGWDGENLVFQPTGTSGVSRVQARATLLALGGASWPRLGSDGAWVPLLTDQGVAVAPLQPANCGFDVLGREGMGWTDHFRHRFAGHPLKSVVLRVEAASSMGHGANATPRFERQGEFVITDTGLEGSLIYAASALLRDDLARGASQLTLDLLPDKSLDQVRAEVRWPRGSRSLSSHLKSRLGIDGVKMGLLFELCTPACLAQPDALALSLLGLFAAIAN